MYHELCTLHESVTNSTHVYVYYAYIYVEDPYHMDWCVFYKNALRTPHTIDLIARVFCHFWGFLVDVHWYHVDWSVLYRNASRTPHTYMNVVMWKAVISIHVRFIRTRHELRTYWSRWRRLMAIIWIGVCLIWTCHEPYTCCGRL